MFLFLLIFLTLPTVSTWKNIRIYTLHWLRSSRRY